MEHTQLGGHWKVVAREGPCGMGPAACDPRGAEPAGEPPKCAGTTGPRGSRYAWHSSAAASCGHLKRFAPELSLLRIRRRRSPSLLALSAQ